MYNPTIHDWMELIDNSTFPPEKRQGLRQEVLERCNDYYDLTRIAKKRLQKGHEFFYLEQEITVRTDGAVQSVFLVTGIYSTLEDATTSFLKAGLQVKDVYQVSSHASHYLGYLFDGQFKRVG